MTTPSPRADNALLMRRRDVLRALACSAGAMLVNGWPLAAHASGPATGQPAPPLTLHALDGRDIATSSLRGKVVILSFWATWCAPCVEELPVLSAYAAANAQRGLQVLGFCLDGPDKRAEVQRMAASLSFPNGFLGSAWAGGYGRIWRLPANFTIDRDGVLADNGWNDDNPAWTAARLEKIVTPLLLKPASAPSGDSAV